MRDERRETGQYGRFLTTHRAIAELAGRQHGVFAVSQLIALGLSADAARRRAGAGRLHRIHHGVYALTPRQLLKREGHWLAAVLACGPDATLSHRTAAALLELRRTDRTKIDVTVATESHRRHAGIDVHRSSTLTAADVTHVQSIPCTTVARTILDLAQVLTRRQLERVFDQAEIVGLLDGRALNDQLTRNKSRHGVPIVQAILAEHYIGSTPTWNDFEEAFLALCDDAGCPRPEVNVLIDPGDGEPALRVDFVWRELRVIVETDGHATHSTRRAFETDRRRDQRLTAAGWRVIRVTWRQLSRERVQVAQTLLALLRR